MTLAERIVFDTLKALGYRDPKQHSEWRRLCMMAQIHIDIEMDAMIRLAAEDAKRQLTRIQKKRWWQS